MEPGLRIDQLPQEPESHEPLLGHHQKDVFRPRCASVRVRVLLGEERPSGTIVWGKVFPKTQGLSFRKLPP